MSRVFIFELPFDYTLKLTTTELLFWGVVLLIVIALTAKSFFVKVQGGREGLAGQSASALSDFTSKGEVFEGQVFCIGEIWTARADFPVKKGNRLIVSGSQGLILFLSNIDDEEKAQ